MQKNICLGAVWGLSSKLLRHTALLLAHKKYLLLKITALEEGAESHTLFGLSYLSFMCRTGMELSLEPARVEEAFTNTGRAAEHPHSPEMCAQSSGVCSLIVLTSVLCQLLGVAGRE